MPWAQISDVVLTLDGADVHMPANTVFIPSDYVWFEFVMEDVAAQAFKSNPGYRGSQPKRERGPLAIPSDREGQSNYARRAQRFYNDRFPSRAEFEAFLEANPDWMFDESTYYASAMSMFTGYPVDEGYGSDLPIPAAAVWFRQFQKRVGSQRHEGRALLKLLRTLEE
jgi:hypothetical protein